LTIGFVEIRKRSSRRAFFLALAVGCAITAYSLTDKMAVARVPTVLYSLCPFLSSLFLAPFVYRHYGPRSGDIIARVRRRGGAMCFLIGIVSWFTYLLVLFVFRDSPASYVVALRETSIVIAAGLGVLVLKERLGLGKAIGVLLIVAGAVVLKFA
jgi:drug/metabolite transporter (DMT)-like permease